MPFQIPTKDKKWIQPNKGDVFGNLFSTFNLDFDSSFGKVRVAPRLRINTDDTDDADLTLPTAFIRTTTGTERWWALCGTRLFRTASTDPTAAFTEATSDDGGTTSPPTSMTIASSDMIEFNGKLYVSLPTDIAELDGTVWDNDWWTTVPIGTALTTGIAHPLNVTKKTNLFMVGDGNLVHVMDKNEKVKNSRLVFPSEFEAIWIRSSYDGTWIGCRNKVNRESEVFFWDESSENYNRGYKVMSDMTFAGVIKNGIPFTVNGEGQLLQFTGSGFQEAAVFPNFQRINRKLDDGNTARRNIHRNGMAVIEGKIHINLNASDANFGVVSQLIDFHSGIWTYDEKQGLRHKYAFTQYDGTEIDYGASLVGGAAGALVPTNSVKGLFLAGGQIFTNATSTLNGIFYRDTNDSINKRGHFITSKFEASSFEDVFQDILVRFKRLRNSSDRILIKYRTLENPNYSIGGTAQMAGTGTWSSTTVFTTTADLSNALAGDEVFIYRGRGSGTLLAISSISEAGGTYTVTLTEAVANASGTFVFMIGEWKLAATISTQGITRQGFDLDAVGTFIQLKVELRSVPGGTALYGDSPELEEIIINNKPEITV